ncbi:MAG: PQQ-binding-like beta-propeller repeat protein, partial [Candidatus Nanohaloarchaea archaeon]|nr:PQQ-binding-like beta-propeller repeat protein [Candidatus Nanohaloarchaea archaeon]
TGPATTVRTSPTATASYWTWAEIQPLESNLTCATQLSEGQDYFRVVIHGDTTVMDVWMDRQDFRISCSTTLDRQQASEQGIDQDAEGLPVQAPDQDSNGEQDQNQTENRTGNQTANQTTGDMAVSIAGYSPAGDAYVVNVQVTSDVSKPVETDLQYDGSSKRITVGPGDNMYSITVPKGGDLTIGITRQDSKPDNNVAKVTLPPLQENDTQTNQTDNDTQQKPNLRIESFTVSDTNPSQGQEIDLETVLNATAFSDQADLLIRTGGGTTIVSDTVSLSGTATRTYTHTYNGASRYTVDIDPSNTFNETDESDNTGSVDITQGIEGDIAITDARTSPTDPHSGENISLVAELSSDGYGGDVTINFSIDGKRVGSTTVSVVSGLSTTASIHHVVEAGQHNLTARTGLRDSKPSNNVASTLFDVAGYESFKVDWKTDIGSGALNIFHRNGRLYTLGAGTVFSINASTGDTLWNKSLSVSVQSPLSPVFGEGMLFFGENEGNRAIGFDISSRNIAWTYKTGYSVRSGAAYSNGYVYMGSDDGSMYAYKASNGDVRWQKGGGELRSTPEIAGRTVYHGEWNSGTLYARFKANGSLRWSVDLAGGIDRSSPYAGNSNVYVGTTAGTLYAVSRSSESVNWSFDVGSTVHSSPIKAGGKVIVGGEGEVLGIWAGNHSLAWNVSTAGTGTVRSSPTVAAGTAYIGGPTGMFYGIDIGSGAIRCQYNTGTAPIKTRPTVVDGSVYVGTTGGKVYRFQSCPS